MGSASLWSCFWNCRSRQNKWRATAPPPINKSCQLKENPSVVRFAMLVDCFSLFPFIALTNVPRRFLAKLCFPVRQKLLRNCFRGDLRARLQARSISWILDANVSESAVMSSVITGVRYVSAASIAHSLMIWCVFASPLSVFPSHHPSPFYPHLVTVWHFRYSKAPKGLYYYTQFRSAEFS